MTTYAQAGVDIDAANNAKRLMADAVKSTHGSNVLAGMGAFGGAIELGSILGRYPDPVLIASTDGVGTKTMIARTLGQFGSVGQDLVNHCINDVLVQGARPLFFLDYIASAHLDAEQVAEIVAGVAAACRASGCALLGGETAEMPGVYAPDAFDLAGTMIGIVDRPRLIDGSTIVPGDQLLGLPSTGLHTNGYSLARSVCEPFGYDSRPPELGGVSLGEALLAVHRSYLPDLDRLWDAGVRVKGMAHLTGGGLLENLPRILPAGCGGRVRLGTWPVPAIFTFLLAHAHLPEAEAYRVLNMGMGMVLVVDGADVAQIQALLPDVAVIGEVMSGSGVELV